MFGMNISKEIGSYVKIFCVCLWSAIVGIGGSCIFLNGLEWVGQMRELYPTLVYFLPLGGVVGVGLYYYFGQGVESGNKVIMKKIDEGGGVISWMMFPLILVCSLISHLFGASVGREGVGVQMSVSLTDQGSKFLKLNEEERRMGLVVGIASGFSGIFGTPLAAIFFALEVAKIKRQEWLKYIVFCGLGSFLCYWGGLYLPIYHDRLGFIDGSVLGFDVKKVFWSVIIGILGGGVAWLFIEGMERAQLLWKFLNVSVFMKVFLGGVLVVALHWVIGVDDFLGLGGNIIKKSFYVSLPLYYFFLKLVFTIICISAGFRGGEVTPLFFIGACLGNGMEMWADLPLSFLSGLGLLSVFCGATKSRLGSIFLGLELFGWGGLGYYIISCLVSCWAGGKKNIYSY